jgi:hypothetical protein
MLRHVFGIEYTDGGVVIRDGMEGIEQARFVSEMVSEQYAATVAEYPCDVELFTKMSLARLGIAVADAPPELADDPLLRETFHISHNGRKSLVFCLEFDGLIDAPIVGRVALRILAHTRSYGPGWGGLCIVHHQRHAPPEVRAIENAMSEEVVRTATDCGLSLVTATDLFLLVQGGPVYRWNIDQVRDLLFLPGRQGMTPPPYREIGTYLRFYERPSVMSVQLAEGEAVRVGDTLALRLATRYYEEQIESLQVEHTSVQIATGPRKVGVKTKLAKADLHAGQRVYVRTQEQPRDAPTEGGQQEGQDAMPGQLGNP